MPIQLSHKQIEYDGYCQHYVFYKNVSSSELNKLADAISEFIYEHKISLVEATICGNRDLYKFHKKAEKKTFGEPNWPITWLNNEQTENNLSGYYSGISGTTVKTLLGSNFINKVFETAQARYCYTGEVYHDNSKNEISTQATNIFDAFLGALAFAGLEPKNTVRTWFYNNDIKEWGASLYSSLNYFAKQNGIVLAATNIGCKNQHKSAIIGSLLAIKPITDEIKVTAIQADSAKDSDSTGGIVVSAIKIRTPKSETILISETSSLIKKDNKAFNSNCEAQVIESLAQMEKILLENDFSWKNMVRAIAYFVDSKDIKLFKQICKEKGIPAAPIITTQVAMNNSDLMFELEADFSKQITA